MQEWVNGFKCGNRYWVYTTYAFSEKKSLDMRRNTFSSRGRRDIISSLESVLGVTTETGDSLYRPIDLICNSKYPGRKLSISFMDLEFTNLLMDRPIWNNPAVAFTGGASVDEQIVLVWEQDSGGVLG